MAKAETKPAGVGHNRPPAFDQKVIDEFDGKCSTFLDAAGDWLELKAINDEKQAEELNDFLVGIRGVLKKVEESRVATKEPHLEAGRAVDAAYAPLKKKLESAGLKVKPMLTAFLQEKERQQQEAARKAAEEARKAREEAERKAREAEARHDVSGEVDAETAREEAEKAAKEAEKAAKARVNVGSASGGGKAVGLRKQVVVEVTDVRLAFMSFMEDPAVRECLQRLGAARARSKDFNPETDKIAGFDIKVEKV